VQNLWFPTLTPPFQFTPIHNSQRRCLKNKSHRISHLFKTFQSLSSTCNKTRSMTHLPCLVYIDSSQPLNHHKSSPFPFSLTLNPKCVEQCLGRRRHAMNTVWRMTKARRGSSHPCFQLGRLKSKDASFSLCYIVRPCIQQKH
jgi:hypothetical protein